MREREQSFLGKLVSFLLKIRNRFPFLFLLKEEEEEKIFLEQTKKNTAEGITILPAEASAILKRDESSSHPPFRDWQVMGHEEWHQTLTKRSSDRRIVSNLVNWPAVYKLSPHQRRVSLCESLPIARDGDPYPPPARQRHASPLSSISLVP